MFLAGKERDTTYPLKSTFFCWKANLPKKALFCQRANILIKGLSLKNQEYIAVKEKMTLIQILLYPRT